MRVEPILNAARGIDSNTLYDRKPLLSLKFDKADEPSGFLIQEVKSGTYEIGSFISPSYTLVFAHVRKVSFADDALANIETLEASRLNCEKLISRLLSLEGFGKITAASGRKVEENEYSANVIGWEVTLRVSPKEVGC